MSDNELMDEETRKSGVSKSFDCIGSPCIDAMYSQYLTEQPVPESDCCSAKSDVEDLINCNDFVTLSNIEM